MSNDSQAIQILEKLSEGLVKVPAITAPPPPTSTQSFDDVDDDFFNDVDIDSLTQGKQVEAKDNRNEYLLSNLASTNSRKFVENFGKLVIERLPKHLSNPLSSIETLCKLIGKMIPLLVAHKLKVGKSIYVVIGPGPQLVEELLWTRSHARER